MKLHGEEIVVGDRVWSVRNGWGVVKRFLVSNDYPIEVEFERSRTWGTYTSCGRLFMTDAMPELFWDEVSFVIPKKPAPPVYEYRVLFERNDGDGCCYGVGYSYFTSLEEYNSTKTDSPIKGIYLIEESKRIRNGKP